jgi:hypothetical protein
MVSWAALVLGVGAVVSSLAASSTKAGEGLTFGFSAFIVFFGLLSLLVRGPTADYWGLFVTGLAMFLLPWLAGGFATDLGASWTAWVAGFLAMMLGGAAWLGGRTPTEFGTNEYNDRQAARSALSFWMGRVSLAVGLATVVLGVTAHSSVVGVAVLIGMGGFTAVIATWSLLADDPTHDFLTLGVVGFALFLGPWVGGFASGSGAVTAWVSGFVITALGVAGYLRGQSLNFGERVREDADTRYRQRLDGG